MIARVKRPFACGEMSRLPAEGLQQVGGSRLMGGFGVLRIRSMVLAACVEDAAAAAAAAGRSTAFPCEAEAGPPKVGKQLFRPLLGHALANADHRSILTFHGRFSRWRQGCMHAYIHY